eukprot:CAMPEP_0178403656 /NCGR_PEP_ID=MMETSP0689_2-20121128/17482_1 /TAXON_ID=160604 /ORGANISM="Amphidinium massartii, Strain CS-259" /LENGTH=504 /DNA_ID=CAMNT_0020024619 /DNA_START=112 /DNA_END=1623 /DNA_ORIENTATION=+
MAAAELPPLPAAWKLDNIPEKRVLKEGLRHLYKVFVEEAGADVFFIPRRASGSSLLLAASFIKRLLNQELELKGCPASDVSNAQPDLKHLNVEQLLTIRSATLDFNAVGASHAAHASFISTMDTHLFEKLGRQCLRTEGAQAPVNALRYAGYRLIVAVGARQVLEAGWDKQSQAAATRGEVPRLWAFELEREEWPGMPVILLHATEMWVWVVSSLPEELAETLSQPEGRIALVSDGSTSVGSERILHWEVSILPPERDLVTELRRTDRARDSANQKRSLTRELTQKLEERERNKMTPEKKQQLDEKSSPPSSKKSIDDSSAGVSPQTPSSQAHAGGMYAGLLKPARDRKSPPQKSPSISESPAKEDPQPPPAVAAEAPTEVSDPPVEAAAEVPAAAAPAEEPSQEATTAAATVVETMQLSAEVTAAEQTLPQSQAEQENIDIADAPGNAGGVASDETAEQQSVTEPSPGADNMMAAQSSVQSQGPPQQRLESRGICGAGMRDVM